MKKLFLAITILAILIVAVILYPRKEVEQEVRLCIYENFFTVEKEGYSVAPHIQGSCDKLKALKEWCELDLANSERACNNGG